MEKTDSRNIIYIPIQEVAVDDMNMRYSPWTGDENDQELVESIKENGVLSPLVIRPVEEPPKELPEVKYGIIAGNRRYHASLEAGLDTIPCIIMEDCDDLKALGVSLQENIHRKSVSGYDKIRQIGRMVDVINLNSPTPENLVIKILKENTGIHPKTLKEYFQFLELPDEIQELAKDPKDRNPELVEKLKEIGVPHRIQKLSIGRGALLSRHSNEFSKERFIELVVTAIDLEVHESDLTELIEAAKIYPKVPIRQVLKEQVFELPKGESIIINLSNVLADALRTASRELQIDRETLIKKYIEKGLKEDGFF